MPPTTGINTSTSNAGDGSDKDKPVVPLANGGDTTQAASLAAPGVRVDAPLPLAPNDGKTTLVETVPNPSAGTAGGPPAVPGAPGPSTSGLIVADADTEFVQMKLVYDKNNPAVFERFILNGKTYDIPYNRRYHTVPLGVKEIALASGKCEADTDEEEAMLPGPTQAEINARRTIDKPNGQRIAVL